MHTRNDADPYMYINVGSIHIRTVAVRRDGEFGYILWDMLDRVHTKNSSVERGEHGRPQGGKGGTCPPWNWKK